ncbi:Protein NUCLEAR FUSION DEFECTIVE [Arachis hypogaea]|nr:Protein NUCLEAR FUSION DEFECTIVE [Arachis hypogaea]
MFLIFFVSICGLGANLAAVDNLGQIGESLGYSKVKTQYFVSLVSVWNFFGRVFSGFASEALLGLYKLPRPWLVTISLFISVIGHVAIVLSNDSGLYIASCIIGFCFGAQIPLISATISEIFGLKHYGALLNYWHLGSPIGSYLMNVLVGGTLYDAEAKNQLKKIDHSFSLNEELGELSRTQSRRRALCRHRRLSLTRCLPCACFRRRQKQTELASGHSTGNLCLFLLLPPVGQIPSPSIQSTVTIHESFSPSPAAASRHRRTGAVNWHCSFVAATTTTSASRHCSVPPFAVPPSAFSRRDPALFFSVLWVPSSKVVWLSFGQVLTVISQK